jgi:uncharacterized protein YbbC (DUF1343 family)
MAVQTGLARLAEEGLAGLKGRRVGLICNPTSVDAELRHAVELLRAKLNVTALFGPEHGVRGDAQDMIGVDDGRDPVSGLPVHSLYGHTEASLTPTPAMLDDVDVVIFDVQDVGSRYYTFVWTMVLAMRACAKAGKQMIVLDRPNPIGGAYVEGPLIEPGFESFVGLVSCSIRHGMTAGEIARWRHAEEKPQTDPDLAALAQESEPDYYKRVFTEYVAQRKAVGSPDDVSFENFIAKLKVNEGKLKAQYNCRTVRFRVVTKDGKVTLKPVPIFA